jgi:hypothetical protein
MSALGILGKNNQRLAFYGYWKKRFTTSQFGLRHENALRKVIRGTERNALKSGINALLKNVAPFNG